MLSLNKNQNDVVELEQSPNSNNLRRGINLSKGSNMYYMFQDLNRRSIETSFWGI